MTVCIAAICDSGNTIVIMADRRITVNAVVALESMKVRRVGTCVVAFAGNVVEADSVHDMASASNKTMKGMADCVSAYEAAIRKVTDAKMESEVTAPLGYGIERFRTQGLKELGPDYYAKTLDAIGRVGFGASFLIAGFADRPRLALLGPKSAPIYLEANTFAAIGENDVALYCLRRSKIRPETTLPLALYHVFSSKRQAESSFNIGPETDAWLIEKQASGPPHVRILSEQAIAALSQAYDVSTAIPDLSAVSAAVTAVP